MNDKQRFTRTKPPSQPYDASRRAPEPTRRTGPADPIDASQEVRVDSANNPAQPIAAPPPPPRPHNDPGMSDTPEGFFMCTLERVALGQLQGPDVSEAFIDWLSECETINRAQLVSKVEFMQGRLSRSLTTTLQAFYQAVSKIAR